MNDAIEVHTESPAQKPFNIVNIDDVFSKATSCISGSARDLIRDAHDNPLAWMHNLHAFPDDNQAAFLIGRGWSGTVEKRKAIADAGIPVMAINDYPKDGPKPRYWVAGDPAEYYGERIWSDADVMKFTPIASVNSARPREDAYAPKLTPRDAPNCNHYHQVVNDAEPESWLHKPWINWGTTAYGETAPKPYYKSGAARSSMLCGMRLLWHLGYRRVFLLGCDCTGGQHPAPMYWPSVLDYVAQLRPTFDRFHFQVLQTNPDAHLRCFDFIGFDEALMGVSH